MPPNFFIVGAPKAGTTSLYHYLRQHPEIFMSPVKEPWYFASEMKLENIQREHRRQIGLDEFYRRAAQQKGQTDILYSHVDADWGAYLRLFDGATGQLAIGEASVCYLWSPTAPGNIRALIPESRIIAILRDPAERAWSQYLHGVANGDITMSFLDQVKTCMKSRQTHISPTYPFLEYGMYYKQVKTYLETFPRDQIRFYFYQDGMASIVRDIFDFLKVDKSFSVDYSRRYLEAGKTNIGRSRYGRKGRLGSIWALAGGPFRRAISKVAFGKAPKLRMRREDRRFLCDYYKADVLQLSSLLNRDLTAWLSQDSAARG